MDSFIVFFTEILNADRPNVAENRKLKKQDFHLILTQMLRTFTQVPKHFFDILFGKIYTVYHHN